MHVTKFYEVRYKINMAPNFLTAERKTGPFTPELLSAQLCLPDEISSLRVRGGLNLTDTYTS
jgi:hypothetical protein